MADEKATDIVGRAALGAAQGAAAGGGVPGAVAGAAKGLASSSRGRRWLMVGLVVLLLSSPVGIVVVTLAFAGLLAGTREAVAAQSYDLASATGVPAGDLSAMQAAAEHAGVPWEVLWALWYYESGPGAGWGTWPGACATEPPPLEGASPLPCPSMPSYPGEPPPTTTTTTTAPPTTTTTTNEKGSQKGKKGGAPATTTTVPPTTTTTQPPIVYLGPFAVRQGVLPASVADSWPGAADWLAGAFAASLTSQPGWWDGLGLASGIVASQDASVPYASTTSDEAQTVRTDMEAALASLPVQGNAGPSQLMFDQNVFELAQATYLGWQPGATTAGVPGGGMVCGQAGAGGVMTVSGPGGTVVTLVPAQLDNAAAIVHVGQGLGVPTQGLVVALGTALTESGLWDLPNGTVPGSETDLNAQWGPYSPVNLPSNGTSVGLFQQQDNWGSVQQRMDPAWSARAFFDGVPGGPGGLLQVPDWQAMPMGLAAQAVQASDFPSRYQAWMPAAQAVLGQAEGISCTPTGGLPPLSGTSATARTIIAAAEAWVGKTPYVWGGGAASGPTMGLSGTGAVAPPAAVGQPGFDCSGLALYAYAKVGVVLPHYSGEGGQWSLVQAAGGFTMDMARLQPGDLVFFNGSDGTSTNPGHVGIYLGNYQMVDALETGTYVEVDYIGPGSAFYATFDGGGPA
jgi:cell wall-associated NlpC family hydrolase